MTWVDRVALACGFTKPGERRVCILHTEQKGDPSVCDQGAWGSVWEQESKNIFGGREEDILNAGCLNSYQLIFFLIYFFSFLFESMNEIR